MSRLERIVSVYGGILLDNGKRALICGPGHGSEDRSVSLKETEDGRILIHCFSPKDDWRAVRNAMADKGLLDAEPRHDAGPCRTTKIASPPAAEDRLVRAERLWAESRPAPWTCASLYLRQRAIAPALLASEALRFHSRMTSLDDRARRPALVAAISDHNGALQGVQVTLLTRYGAAKAVVSTPRRIVGKLIGGAVRLAPAAKSLIVAEGVETALSASAAFAFPAWAALSAHNLSLFEPPPEVTRLIVAADNDAAGRAAAEALARRLGASIEVEIRAPDCGSKDWNERARRLQE